MIQPDPSLPPRRPHPLHRAARWLLLPVLAAWCLATACYLRPTTHHLSGAAILAAFAFSLIALGLYLRGITLTFNRLLHATSGAACFRCGYDLYGAFGTPTRRCPECGEPLTEGQQKRLEMDGC